MPLGEPMNDEFCIAVAQSSSVKGDIAENVRLHERFASRAAQYGAKIIVFPELSLTGYEPTLAAETAIDAKDPELNPLTKLSNQLGITIVVGCPVLSGEKKPYVGAFVIRPDGVIATYRKRFLGGNENHYFVESDGTLVCRCHQRSVGIAICADIHHPAHAAACVLRGATVYAAGVAIDIDDIGRAETDMSQHARDHTLLAAMANHASSTGGYSIAGRSAIWNEFGDVVARAPESGECVVIAKENAVGWAGHVISLDAV